MMPLLIILFFQLFLFIKSILSKKVQKIFGQPITEIEFFTACYKEIYNKLIHYCWKDKYIIMKYLKHRVATFSVYLRTN